MKETKSSKCEMNSKSSKSIHEPFNKVKITSILMALEMLRKLKLQLKNEFMKCITNQ